MSALKDIQIQRQAQQIELYGAMEKELREVSDALKPLGRLSLAENYKEARFLAQMLDLLHMRAVEYQKHSFELRDLARIQAEIDGVAR